MFGGQVTNASLLKLQQNRQKEEARRSVRENKDADDDGGEFRGPDPGFDENFVSQNVSLKKRELEGLSLTPMQLLELQRKEDEIAENGPGGSPAIALAMRLEPVLEVEAPSGTKNLCGRFSPDGSFLALGCADGAVRLVNTQSGRTAFEHNPGLAHRTVKPAVTSLRFRPAAAGEVHNLVAFCTSEGQVVHWHATSGNLVGKKIQEDMNSTLALDYRPDGARFSTAGLDRKVRLYDADTQKLVCAMAADPSDPSSAGHTDRIFSVKYTSANDDLLVSGGWDDSVYVWDGRCGRAVRSFFGPHVCGDSLDFREAAGAGHVLAGSWREREALQVWDLGKGQLVENLPWRPAKGQAPCFIYAAMYGAGPLARFIAAGGSKSNEFRVVDKETGRPVARLADLPTAVNGIDLSTGGAEGGVVGAATMAVICEHAAYMLSMPVA